MPGNAGPKDMVDHLIEDHREMDDLFTDLESNAGSADERRAKVTVVIAELVRHSVAEEIHLYPTARQALPDGDKIVDHEIEQHADAERVMMELEGLEASDPDFDRLVSALMVDVRHHIDDEEGDLFPRLRQACTRDDLVALGKKLEAAKASAPTRPDPSSSDTPHGNELLAPEAGLVERIREAVSNPATSPDDPP
jgi:hemerythrin superfamily protein